MTNKEESKNKKIIINDEKPDNQEFSQVDAAFKISSFAKDGSYIANDVVREEEGITSRVEEVIIAKQTLRKSSINFEEAVNSIEEGFPLNRPLEANAFPHPRNWIGPRYLVFWSLPIIAIHKAVILMLSLNPVRPYKDSEATITKAETIFTVSKQVFQGSSSIKFFGPLFLSIWVLPLAITGTFMEILFVSPLKNTNPFG